MSGPQKIRVLVVDDSVVVRRIISDVLASDPAFEVAGGRRHR
jgi:two-component system chemotaxis response regulator CheB